MGRPTKYSEGVGQRIVVEIRRGLAVKFAAALAGVGEQTLRDWLAKGEAESPPDADGPLVAFAELYRSAEAEYAAQELASIDGEVGEGKGDWKRTAWKLEKRFPKEFGPRVALEHSGPNGGPIEINDARARILALVARGDEPGAEGDDPGEPQR